MLPHEASYWPKDVVAQTSHDNKDMPGKVTSLEWSHHKIKACQFLESTGNTLSWALCDFILGKLHKDFCLSLKGKMSSFSLSEV